MRYFASAHSAGSAGRSASFPLVTVLQQDCSDRRLHQVSRRPVIPTQHRVGTAVTTDKYNTRQRYDIGHSILWHYTTKR
jgi:hypothetical protein